MSRHRDDASHDPGRLGEPATEQYVGRRDLTHWSRPVRAFVGLVLRISRNSSAWHVLLVTAAVGAGIALFLNWAAEEIYDSVKAADGLSSLDEPVLELQRLRLGPPSSWSGWRVTLRLGESRLAGLR